MMGDELLRIPFQLNRTPDQPVSPKPGPRTTDPPVVPPLPPFNRGGRDKVDPKGPLGGANGPGEKGFGDKPNQADKQGQGQIPDNPKPPGGMNLNGDA